MRRSDCPLWALPLFDELREDQRNAREAIDTTELLLTVVRPLTEILGDQAADVLPLLEECRSYTARWSAAEIERFVVRRVHILPKELQEILDRMT